MYKLRTVDVWDTLLRRDCHPECIKLATAHHLLFGWSDQLRSSYCDGWSLYQARLDAEKKLAEHAKTVGTDDEYEITDVLSQWVGVVFAKTAPEGLPAYLAEIELSIEVARSSADPEISAFLRSVEAEKTVFLSDFYMNSEMLARLLASKGLDTLVSNGLSSCDVGLNKRSGKIYQHIHLVHDLSPEQHVHIGDNEWSDVLSPRALGVHALHYLPESAHAERLMRERLFSSRDVLFDHLRLECSTVARDVTMGMPARLSMAMNLGVQAAPLFIGFALWIAEQSILQKCNRLYFLTREGEFFYKIFSVLFPDGELFGHALPPTNILAVSRLSTFGPSMRNISIEEMSRIWSLFRVQSVSGLFITLGVDIKNFSQLLNKLGLKETDIIHNPENSLALRQLFQTPAFAEAVKTELASQSNLLESYLKGMGISAGERIGIVDVGWRGTIQDNLALLVPDAHFHGMYLGLRRYINDQPTNVSKGAYGPDENSSDESTKLFTNFAAMELLCHSPHGSVAGYAWTEGRVDPLRQIDEIENVTYDVFVGPFQEGVLLAAQHWQSYLKRYVVTSSELRNMALTVWDTLRQTPAEALVEMYLHTPQQDIFGYGEIFKRDQYPSLSTIFLSPVLSAQRRVLIEFIRRVQWSEAIASARDIGWIHRRVLLLAFQAAHLIKRTSLKMKQARLPKS